MMAALINSVRLDGNLQRVALTLRENGQTWVDRWAEGNRDNPATLEANSTLLQEIAAIRPVQG